MSPGPPRHPQLPAPDDGYEYATRNIDGQQYMTTGLFPVGAEHHKLRLLHRAAALVLDFDLKVFLAHQQGIDEAAAEAAVLASPVALLGAMLDAMWAEQIVPALRAATMGTGIPPITAAVRSGGGWHCYFWLSDEDGYGEDQIAVARRVNKELVSRVNGFAGYQLADPKCVDAGTRILRVVGSQHLKNKSRPVPVVLEHVSPERRVNLSQVADEWQLSVPVSPPRPTNGASGDKGILKEIFEARSDKFLELCKQDPVFRWARDNPGFVGYEMRRFLAQNLIAAARPASPEAARKVFLEIASRDASHGSPSNKRFDVSLMSRRFDEAVDSLSGDGGEPRGPLTYGVLKEQISPKLWNEIFPDSAPEPDLNSSAAGQQSRRLTAAEGNTKKKKGRPKKRGRKNRMFQTGRIGADVIIKGLGWEGSLSDWFDGGPKNSDGDDQFYPIFCPVEEAADDIGARVVLKPNEDVYVVCRQESHEHYDQGRISWYVDIQGGVDPNIEVLARLEVAQNGKPLSHLVNLETVLENDSRFRERFWFNSFSKNLMIGDTAVVDADVTNLAIEMGRLYGIHIGKRDDLWQTLGAVARRYGRNPVMDAFESAHDGWDGKPRIDLWLTRALGADTTALYRAYGRRFLIGMAARVLVPGCKRDEVLVLIGEQGVGKSTACRILVGNHLFADTAIDLRNKDAFMNIHQVILYEFAELRGLNASQETTKNFLSSQLDRFRPPYLRSSEEFPRHTVFVATGNNEEILGDETGSRRYWPVEVSGSTDRHQWLFENREQLLGEAVHCFRQWQADTDDGDPRHLHKGTENQWWLTDGEEALRKSDAGDFYVTDSRSAPLLDWAIRKRQFTLRECLEDVLGLYPDKQDRKIQREMGSLLRQGGWRKKRVRKSAGLEYVWFHPDLPPLEVVEGGEIKETSSKADIVSELLKGKGQ